MTQIRAVRTGAAAGRATPPRDVPSQRLAAASRGKTQEIIQIQYCAKQNHVLSYKRSTFRGDELFSRQSTCVT